VHLQENAIKRLRFAKAADNGVFGPLMALVGVFAGQPREEVMERYNIPTLLPSTVQKTGDGTVAAAHFVYQIIAGDLRPLKLFEPGPLGCEAVGYGQIAPDCDSHNDSS